MKAHASPKPNSSPGAGRPQPNRGKAPTTRGAAPPSTTTATGAASTPAGKKQRYTVIITNVENDFAKLHSACIPYYCGLRGDYEETLDAEKLVREGGRPTQRLIAAQRGCSYAVRCRTETRTAEVSLYGPADANFAAMQLVKPPRRPPTPTTPVAKKPAHGGGGSGGGSSSDAAEPEVAVVVPAPAADDAADVTAVPLDVAGGGVERLALRLRRQHYFEEKLPVSVHLPGRAADEVLLRLNKSSTGETNNNDGADDDGDVDNDDDDEDDNSEVDEEGAEKGVALGPKRSREDASSSSSDEDNDEDKQAAPALQRVKTEASDATKAEDDSKEAVVEEGGEESKTTMKKKPRKKRTSTAHTLIKQFPNRQKDFVSAVAAMSARTPLRRVRRRLHDLPGYLSCWSLYDRHLRVVFRDAESLFKAKQLLDQFELEAGLRVSLTLSDPLSRTNAEFTQAQESERAME